MDQDPERRCSEARGSRARPGAAMFGATVAGVPIIEMPVSRITDWDNFHDVFAATLGFPDFYGRNMDAWLDCLTYRDEDDGMASAVMAPGDVLTRQLDEGQTLLSAARSSTTP